MSVVYLCEKHKDFANALKSGGYTPRLTYDCNECARCKKIENSKMDL